MRHQKVQLALLGLSTILLGSMGCQTYMGGMTLPTGHYLEYTPQYIPRDTDDNPLPRERATQESYLNMMNNAQANPGGGAAVPPVPPVPGAVPPPAPVPLPK